jgi:tetratricopeptide (TPR) repeat protein
MAAKNKKRAGRTHAPPAGDLGREVQRLIEKDRLKDAVKQAKLYVRQEDTPESRRLLERAYFLRAQQLHRGGMPESAREVARHLLDFGVGEPALAEEFAQLLLALGMAAMASGLGDHLESPEAKERLARGAADQAVLHPQRAPASLPEEIRQGALLVRSSLEALTGGDEEKALAALRDVARSSPLADWKLFVRGLAASYRHDVDEMRANWDRLDPQRAASRIARTLQALADPGAVEAGQRPAGTVLEVLERVVWGEPVLTTVGRLRDFVAQDRWRDAFKLLATARRALRDVDPGLPARITAALYAPLIRASTGRSYQQGMGLIQQFIKAADPLPIDPRWNRLWALVWEGPQGHVAEAEPYWRAYVKDLEGLPILSPDERRLAQALVWTHLATRHLDEAEADDGLIPGLLRRAKDVQASKRSAIECLEEGLRLCPTHRAAYGLLLKTYQDGEQPEQAADVARRLLASFPEDFDALMFLAAHHHRRDEPSEALDYVRLARALKPLDRSAANLEWILHVASARLHARAKRWEEGRVAFRAAEALQPAQSATFSFLAKRAVFELKARQADLGESLIEQAKAKLVEPTPLWLALQVEAVRYGLSKAHKDRFTGLWKAALKAKCRSETAGELASLLAAHMEADVQYTGRAGHVEDVVDYLRRTTKVKYRREDLREVCKFLDLLPDEASLLEKMVRRGLKEHPSCPYFLYMIAELEIRKGPLRCDRRLALERLEKARELAQASSDPGDAALLPTIKERLTMMAEVTEGPAGLPFGVPGGGPLPFGLPSMPDPADMPPQLLDMFREICEQMGVDPDDLDADDFNEMLPPPRPRRPGPKRKKR